MTRRGIAAILMLIGAALFAAGLLYGFSSIKRYGVDCGSALGGYDSRAAETADLTGSLIGTSPGPGLSPVADACSAAVSDRTPVAWALVGPGGLLLLGGLVARGLAWDAETTPPTEPSRD